MDFVAEQALRWRADQTPTWSASPCLGLTWRQEDCMPEIIAAAALLGVALFGLVLLD